MSCIENLNIFVMTSHEEPSDKKTNKFIMTSRFNNSTWGENCKYRNEQSMQGCIYGSPELNNKIIPVDSILFILEMNNDINKIMGIGMVKNKPICCKYSVYNNGNYNRYIYKGNYRIDRTEMSLEEMQIIMALDVVCFKGNYHMKRGYGLKSFPRKMLEKAKPVIDLEKEFTQMFKTRFL
jgi:hypothetical protein